MGKGDSGSMLNKMDASQKVWVGNLSPDTTREELEAHFKQLGEPVCVEILPKGVGCVAYATAEEAQSALLTFNFSELKGAVLQTDSWTAKPKGEGKGAKGKPRGTGSVASAGYATAAGKKPILPGVKGSVGAASNWGGGTTPRGSLSRAVPSALGWGGGKGDMMQGWWWGAAPQWAAAAPAWEAPGKAWGPPAAKQWAAAVEPPAPLPEVYRLRIDEASPLVQQGLPAESVALYHSKAATIFQSAARILADALGDDAPEVTMDHDPDWEKYPYVGEAVKEAGGEHNCLVVATCAARGKWAVGMAPGWKTREMAAKLALAVVLAGEDKEILGKVAKFHPEFRTLCRVKGGAALAAAAAAAVAAPVAPAPAVAISKGPEVPKVSMITLTKTSSLTAEGFPPDAPAITYTKELKEYFSGAHNLLCEVVEEINDVVFQDDVDGVIFPEVGEALTEAGEAATGYCVARYAAGGRWAVGIGTGWKVRQLASKLSLAMALAQATGKLEQLAAANPEFAAVCASVGLAAPPPKRRRTGGWW